MASGQLARPQLEGLWCTGELGLNGSLRPCRGVIALAEKASSIGPRPWWFLLRMPTQPA
ncbi:hypothetical protein [Parasynechococcus sp.]|uniref:hypothetical protein n=1 Tax=Parasynechococcus sp. TaxID=3101203 RepID=UPI0037039434